MDIQTTIKLETKQRQLVRWILDESDSNACITGDCTHEKISECIDALLQQFKSQSLGT